jgi:acetyltransferase
MGTGSGLFDAERVAVVGATERDGSVGAAVMRNLLDDFAGEIETRSIE